MQSFKSCLFPGSFNRRTPEEHGWIMDGFPSTVAQAKLLEKALSGYDANAKPSRAKLRQSRLALDPNPPKDPPPPVSGIDLVVLFEALDELVLKRAAGRTCTYKIKIKQTVNA